MASSCRPSIACTRTRSSIRYSARQAVGTDLESGGKRCWVGHLARCRRFTSSDRLCDEAAQLPICSDQGIDLSAEIRVPGAGVLQVRPAGRARAPAPQEKLPHVLPTERRAHGGVRYLLNSAWNRGLEFSVSQRGSSCRICVEISPVWESRKSSRSIASSCWPSMLCTSARS